AGARRYEYLTSSIGSTVRYEYLPLRAQERPWTSSYVTFGEAGRLHLLPGQNASIADVRSQGMGFMVDVDAAESRPLVFEQHWFQGWRATVDGAEAAIWPSEPEGFITVGVPSGRHRLQLEFSETRLRQTADFVAIGSGVLLIVLAGAWLAARR